MQVAPEEALALVEPRVDHSRQPRRPGPPQHQSRQQQHDGPARSEFHHVRAILSQPQFAMQPKDLPHQPLIFDHIGQHPIRLTRFDINPPRPGSGVENDPTGGTVLSGQFVGGEFTARYRGERGLHLGRGEPGGHTRGGHIVGAIDPGLQLRLEEIN